MKKQCVLLIIVLSFVMSVLFLSCSNKPAIVGKWSNQDTIITFNVDGSVEMTSTGIVENFRASAGYTVEISQTYIGGKYVPDSDKSGSISFSNVHSEEKVISSPFSTQIGNKYSYDSKIDDMKMKYKIENKKTLIVTVSDDQSELSMELKKQK